MANADDSYKKLVSRRHPDYLENIEHWDFLEDCYEGGRGWFEDNIFKYLKEGDKEFKERVARAYRFNHAREVVELVNKYIFKMPITRNDADAPDCVKAFWKKSTRNTRPIELFSREFSLRSSIYGRVWVVVDSTAKQTAEKKVISKADEKISDFRVYAYIVEPQSVLDFSYDENGELNWILIHESIRDDVDPLNSSGAEQSRYRLWTRTEWLLFSETKVRNKVIIALADRGEHNLGVVPVVEVDNSFSDDTEVPSLIADIAYLDRAVANYLSNLDAIIQDQTFSQLAMPAQNLSPGEDTYDKMVEIGTKRIFLYDGEGGSAPFFLSPDVKQAELILSAIHKIINEIYHTVGLAGERTKQDNSMGIDNSSGVAKAYDFERVNALLANKADALEVAENRILKLVAMWNGEELDTDLVKYPDTFDVRNLSDEFDIAMKLSLIEAPEELRREQMKAVVEKLFPKIPEELKKKIDAELLAWPPKVDLAGLTQSDYPSKSKQGQVGKGSDTATQL